MNLGPFQIVAPILLLGILAAGIPVLLHLLAKVRAPQVFFPTLRFLRMSMDKTARRRRVQHWLLMLLRMLALAVLAIAVAQPLVRAAAGQLGSDRDTAVVVILDNSLSMQTQSAGATRLETSRSAALQFLQSRNFQQAGLLVTNGSAGRSQPDALIDRFKVIDQVRKVTPGIGRADLATAIEHAGQLLASANLPNKEIYLFTDLQRVSTRGLDSLPTRRGGSEKSPPPSLLVVTPTGADGDQAADAGPTNLAVSEVAIDQPNLMAGQPVILDVTVRNFSRLAQKAMVRLFQDGRERPEMLQVVDLAAANEPGAARHVTFAVTFAEAGNHFGWAAVQRVNQAGLPGPDDLPEDDCRYFSLDLADRVNVLLVKQRHDLDPSADAGYMLRRLMAVRMAGGPANPFCLAEITAAEFAPPLLGHVTVAITSDVAGFTPEEAHRYREFAERGGTWMIWLGPSADLNSYNQALGQASGADGGVLGGELARYVGSATGGRETQGEPVFVQWVDESHPMFQKIYPDLSAYRRLLVFRHAVLQRRSDQGGRVLAKLSTGDPLVVETPLGRGRVLLFTTAACPRWTNWLTQGQAFAVYQMLLAAATKGRPGAAGSAGQFSENDLVTIELPASAALAAASGPGQPRQVSVQKPDRQLVTVAASAAGPGKSAGAAASPSAPPLAAKFAQTDQVGVYRWQLLGAATDAAGAGAAVRGTFVVNPPADESDLQPLTGRELASLLPDRPVVVGHSLADLAGKIEQFRKGSPLWPYLFAAVLVLLAVEAKLANRSKPTGEAALRAAFGHANAPAAGKTVA